MWIFVAVMRQPGELLRLCRTRILQLKHSFAAVSVRTHLDETIAREDSSGFLQVELTNYCV